MKRIWLVGVVLAGLAFPLAASGAEVKSCGDYLGYTNLRERGTSCATARKVAHAEWVYPHGIGASHVLLGWKCHAAFTGDGYVHRCLRGSAVIRFDEHPS